MLPRQGVQRASAVLACAIALGCASLGPLARPAGAAIVGNTPSGQVLIVTENLDEAFNSADVLDPSDADRFVPRLLSQAPYTPDVVLLQEVRPAVATRVAQQLTEQSGQSFVVAVAAPKLYVNTVDSQYVRDTAILINSQSMAQLDPGGMVATRYAAGDAAPGTRRQDKGNAYVSVGQLSSGIKLALADVHLIPSSSLQPGADASYRAAWSRKIARKLAAAYPDPGATTVIGGDFNSDRCTRLSTGWCDQMNPFYTALRDDLGFKDAVNLTTHSGGVDYVFGNAGVVDGGVDDSYDPSNAATFYSDHRFRWAILGEWPAVPASASANGSDSVGVSWSDAGHEDGYRVERSPDGLSGWTEVGEAPADATSLSDAAGLAPLTPYYYRVIAYRGQATNAPSNVVSATTSEDVTPPNQPSDVSGWVGGYYVAKVNLKWKASVDQSGVASYNIYRSANNGSSYVLAGTTTTNKFQDPSLDWDKKYVYVVKAVDTLGNTSEGSPSFAIWTS